MDLVLRQERIERGWTQEFVAKRIGTTKTTVQMLETGQRKPSYNVLVKLLDLFEYNDPRELFGAATPIQKKPDGNRAISLHQNNSISKRGGQISEAPDPANQE